MHRPPMLVGRDEVLARCARHLDRVHGVHGRALVIEGPAGIGKTALTKQLVDHLAKAKATIRRGAARELESDLPFAALSEALALDSPGADDERTLLAKLLRGGSDATLDERQRRRRLIDGMYSLLEDEAETGNPILVLEDLHWVDQDSATALARVANNLDHLPIGLIVTVRPDPHPPHLAAALRALDDAGAMLVRLSALDVDEVSQLAGTVVGVPPSPALTTALDRAGGNPLYVLELLDALHAEGAIDVRDGVAELSTSQLPPSLRLTVIRKLGHLPEETIEVLQQAAALGESSTLLALGAVTGRAAADLTRALEPAYRNHLLDPASDAVTFRHALIRDALYEDLPATTRTVLHATAARALDEAGAPRSQVALHLSRALQPGDVDGALRLLDAAGRLVDAAPGLAESYGRQAADALPPGHNARLGAKALIARATVRIGQPAEAEALARELDDEGLEQDLRLELWETVTFGRHLRGEYSPEALATYEATVRAADLDPSERARHLALIAFSHRWDRPDLAIPIAEEVLETATDDAVRVQALTALGPANVVSGQPGLGGETTARAVELVRTAGLELSWVGIEALGAFGFLRSIDPGGARVAIEALQTALAAAEAEGLLYAIPTLHIELARTNWFQGDFDAAATHAETAHREMLRSGYGETALTVLTILGDVLLHRGSPPQAERVRDGLRTAFIDAREWPLMEAAYWVRRGDLARAWELSTRVSEWVHDDDPTLFISVVWTLPYVHGALAAGEREAAVAWVEHLERIDESQGGAMPPFAAVAALGRALVDRTVEHARGAITAARRSAVNPFRLDGFWIAGEILAEHDERDEALEILKEGRDLADRAGATVLVGRYDAMLRDLGVRRGAVGRGRPDTGWDALTEAENRVLHHVAEGLTYREVGERLFISRRTVETHVANIFRKVGVGNRNELTHAYLERSAAHAESGSEHQ